MKDKGVQKSTQNKIIKYARYFLSRENLTKVKDDTMVQFLSEDLKDDLIREVNVKILSQCKMFTYNFRTKFLLAISRALIERAFGPDEVIFRVIELKNFHYNNNIVNSFKREMIFQCIS